jgi:hypothetical protein
MATNGAKGQKLGKAALARVNSVASGDVTTVDARVSPMAQSLGIVFGTNYTVASNQTTARLTTVESAISNLEGRVTSNEDDKLIAMNKLNAIATVLGITFNSDGTLNTEAYSSHTHSYEDSTINDTADGTGTETVTVKSSSGVE